MFGATPSMFIFCRTASSGNPILNIFRYFVATASSSADKFDPTAGAEDSVAAGLSSLFPSTAWITASSTPSEFILARTASGGRPIFSILRKRLAIGSSSISGVFSLPSVVFSAAGSALPAATSPTTATITTLLTPSCTILCFTASGGSPILSIFRYVAASASSSAESLEFWAELPSEGLIEEMGGMSPRTSATMFSAMPSIVILLRTASDGIPIFSILRYRSAISLSSPDKALIPVDPKFIDERRGDIDVSSDRTAEMMIFSTLSCSIRLCTCSFDRPCCNMIRYEPAIANCSAVNLETSILGSIAGRAVF
mmetsp:Transcript_15018/g.28688  ORF Transcript_15018/g.28688 Transcript_15018/m.28688 type:complete len:311 (+) Transcript_15018:3076-4008(+)